MKTIKILGTGCSNCVRLEANVKIALEKAWIEAHVEKVTEIDKIMSYGVMWTPGLVIDEKVISSGKVNEVDEIISLLQNNKCCENDDNCCNETKVEEKSSCCSSSNTSCCSPKKEEKVEKQSSCCSEKDSSCCSKEDTNKNSGLTCGKNWCWEKLISATRILFITAFMTAIFTYMKNWDVLVWLKNWWMMFVIVLTSMCFIIRPLIIVNISKKIWQKKWKMVWMILLMFLMSILFTYRFNWFWSDVALNIAKNFWMLFIMALPLVFLVINPILNLIFKKK